MYFCEYMLNKLNTQKQTDIIINTPPATYFVLTSAHNFLEQFYLRLVEYTLCLDQSITVILSFLLCTPIYCQYWCTHFGWPRYSAVQMMCTLVL